MKLTLNYELNISPQNEALIPIVASTMGFIQQQDIPAVEAVAEVLDGEGNVITPAVPAQDAVLAQTPKEFLKIEVEKDIKNYFRNRVEEAHRMYTGLSGLATRAVLVTDLMNNSTCNVEFVTE